MDWNYFVIALKRYNDFSGRSRRKEFWNLVLFDVLISIALSLIGIKLLVQLFSLVMLVPGLAASFRRLHDVGKSAWWLLIALIPVVGAIVLIVFYTTDSMPGENEYGPNPKNA